MISLEAEDADGVWRQAVQLLRSAGAIQESRDQPTRELLHVALTITNPRQRIVFSRSINPAFAIAEVIWIMAGANDVDFLRFWNPRMEQFADDDKMRFHGAYGYRLGSQPALRDDLAQQLRHEGAPRQQRFDQLRAAYETLSHSPHSRQVVLQIWDSQIDMPNPEPRSKDIPCNIISHLLVRNGKLDWLQVMRSNDLIWGTPYNFIQFTSMQEIVAGWLGLDVGTYNHVSDSLHAYQRHWGLVDRQLTNNTLNPRNYADLRLGSYVAWEAIWARLVEGVLQLIQYTEEEDLLRVADELADLPPAYVEWVILLTAEALRRRGFLIRAERIIDSAGPFWENSWRQWVVSLTT